MKLVKRGGFTIIETMLVIAVGGLLTAGLLAGAGLTITKQRYRESVISLQAFIQDGYNLTVVSQNDRDGKWSCKPAGVEPADHGDNVGQTDCLLVGRYITVNDSGVMKNQGVIAYQNKGTIKEDDSLTDVYNFFVSDQNTLEQPIAWSSWITKPSAPADKSNVSILILRSPLNNAITTYSLDKPVPDSRIGSELISSANENHNLDMCVRTEAAFAGRTQAVRVKPRASNTGAVVIPDESEGVCNE